MQFNIKTQTTQSKRWVEDLDKHFFKEDMQMAKRNRKRCSTSLIISKMQNKTTTEYHLTLVRMAIIKNLQIINAQEGVEKREPSCIVDRNAN